MGGSVEYSWCDCGFSDSVFNVISAFLADNNQRFVAEVEAIEL
jgi:hypothetical protein